MPLMEDLMVNHDPTVQEDSEVGSTQLESGDSATVESESPPLRLCSLERQQAKRDKLNRILLHLLDKLPSKNGECQQPIRGHFSPDPI